MAGSLAPRGSDRMPRRQQQPIRQVGGTSIGGDSTEPDENPRKNELLSRFRSRAEYH